MKANKLRTCARCGTNLVRKRYNLRIEPLQSYLTRKFCSIECSGVRTKGKRKPSNSESRSDQISKRISEIQSTMALRGTSDPCIELVAEHRDLVRERNAIENGKDQWLR